MRAAASAHGGPNNCAAMRRYLRRLAPKVRPPQPPKINVIHAPYANSRPRPKTQENSKYSTQFVVGFNYLYYFWGKRSVIIGRRGFCSYKIWGDFYAPTKHKYADGSCSHAPNVGINHVLRAWVTCVIGGKVSPQNLIAIMQSPRLVILTGRMT